MLPKQEALDKLLDRLFGNLKSISVINKVLSIIHRSLQEEMISHEVSKYIKKKENMLFSCIREEEAENTEDGQMRI